LAGTVDLQVVGAAGVVFELRPQRLVEEREHFALAAGDVVLDNGRADLRAAAVGPGRVVEILLIGAHRHDRGVLAAAEIWTQTFAHTRRRIEGERLSGGGHAVEDAVLGGPVRRGAKRVAFLALFAARAGRQPRVRLAERVRLRIVVVEPAAAAEVD